MKSPFYFIAKPMDGKRYNNTKDIGDIEFITSTSEEDHRFSNRLAVVEALPIGYTGPVKPGDVLLVHHNTFKYYNDMKGRQQSGKSFFRDDLFFIEPDQFFMYFNENGWNAYDRYCFVEPIEVKDSFIKKMTTEEPLMGRMAYPNDYLKSQGVSAGDTICFKPESEYVFMVDGQKMYRMFDHQITMTL